MFDESITNLENQLQLKTEVQNLLTEDGISMMYYRKLLYVTAKIHFRSIDLIGKKKYHKILERNKEEFVSLSDRQKNLNQNLVLKQSILSLLYTKSICISIVFYMVNSL